MAHLNQIYFLSFSASVYVSEVVSAEWRGCCGSSLSFAMVIGLQVGYQCDQIKIAKCL